MLYTKFLFYSSYRKLLMLSNLFEWYFIRFYLLYLCKYFYSKGPKPSQKEEDKFLPVLSHTSPRFNNTITVTWNRIFLYRRCYFTEGRKWYTDRRRGYYKDSTWDCLWTTLLFISYERLYYSCLCIRVEYT